MKVNNVLDIFGGLILLAAIAVVATHPSIVSTTFSGFNTALGTAVKGYPVAGKLAHIRQLGRGDPMWGQTQRWSMIGAQRSVSAYDVPFGSEDDNLDHRVRAGIETRHQREPISEPTTSRFARYSYFSSVPDAAHWQGYFSTTFNWVGNVLGSGVVHPAHSPLFINANPGQAGTKELNPNTPYNPYPPASAFYTPFGV